MGGVGYRWQSDGSFGLVACDTLASLPLPDGVEVADLGYGALHAAQDIAAAAPPWERLILLAAAPRGREAGALEIRTWQPGEASNEDVQALVLEAGGGVLHVDHLLVIGSYFGWLPPEVVLVELEPAVTDPGEPLSLVGRERLDEAVEIVRNLLEQKPPQPGVSPT